MSRAADKTTTTPHNGSCERLARLWPGCCLAAAVLRPPRCLSAALRFSRCGNGVLQEPNARPENRPKRRASMRERCPICLDRVAKEAFGLCAHQFCSQCLDEWSRQSADASCPLCRSSVAGIPPAPAPPVSRMPEPAVSSRAWRYAPSGATSGDAASYYRLSTIRERAEREHAERAERHKDRKVLEQRLDRYRASVFTPSGRPYDSLPTVSLQELRTVLAGNKRRIHGPVPGS